MKRTAFYILLFASVAGCSHQKKIAARNERAEAYYAKAFEILNSTSHNALSQSLAQTALGYINHAIAIDPSQTKYFRVKGTSYYHLKKYDSAVVYHEQAIKLDSTNFLAWMGHGVALENMTKYPLAEKSYLTALKYDEKSSVIYYNFGMLYSRWGKDSLSLLAYDKAIMLDPGYTDAYVNRGYGKLASGKYLDAIADFNKSIYFDPINKITYNNRGLCQYYLGQYEAAINDFQKALSIKLGESYDENFNTDKYSNNNIANAYFALGNKSEACVYWKKAIKMGYKYQPEWKKEFNIDDPAELVKKHCQ